MHPIIAQFGPVTIYSYGLMMAVAVVVCSWLMVRNVKNLGINGDALYDFVFWVILSGIAGARIFYVLLNLDFFIQNPGEIVMIQHGGLAFQGGFILGAAAAFIYIRKKKWPLWPLLDRISPYLALGHAIGRVGCFLNGCCYGRPVGWGVYFPVHHDRLHPTQFYDTVALAVVFFALKKFQSRPHIAGLTFVLYLILASLERFVNEFFRGDHVNTLLGMSVYQWVSLGIFSAGLAVFLKIKNIPHRN